MKIQNQITAIPFKKSARPRLAVILVIVGLTYNFVFAEEFLFGKINGSAPETLLASVEFIRTQPEITKVLTFNDIGAGNLSLIGKYAGRIYATPDA
ncbi:MAG: hypothetical protein AAB649_03600, partial [Patescibacteria group bacterium]